MSFHCFFGAHTQRGHATAVARRGGVVLSRTTNRLRAGGHCRSSHHGGRRQQTDAFFGFLRTAVVLIGVDRQTGRTGGTGQRCRWSPLGPRRGRSRRGWCGAGRAGTARHRTVTGRTVRGRARTRRSVQGDLRHRYRHGRRAHWVLAGRHPGTRGSSWRVRLQGCVMLRLGGGNRSLSGDRGARSIVPRTILREVEVGIHRTAAGNHRAIVPSVPLGAARTHREPTAANRMGCLSILLSTARGFHLCCGQRSTAGLCGGHRVLPGGVTLRVDPVP
mmetsp:Transcript_44840/g.78252  ORF Transcript_44840/g.78252 Transcript_44840/m.78252 type:complete len:275 (+) Transcript_44840:281-1105(+)